MNRRLCAIMMAAALLVTAYTVRANAVGTASGTAIVNFATMTASGGFSTQTQNVTTTVQAVYGLSSASVNEVNAGDQTVTAGGYYDYQMSIQNRGNASDYIGINIGAFSFTGNPGTTGNWSVAADDAFPFVAGLTWQNSAAASASAVGDWATFSTPIAPGGVATFTVRVQTAADATDGASMSFTLKYQIASTPAGEYTGFNGTLYGGPATVWRTAGTLGAANSITTAISGAVLSLTKNAVVVAPAGYTGGASDPVPGARITYTITYGNSGSANASSVVITDGIPANTTYVSGSIVTSAFGAMSDAGDADKCDFGVTYPNAVYCAIGTLNAFSTGNTIVYQVTID